MVRNMSNEYKDRISKFHENATVLDIRGGGGDGKAIFKVKNQKIRCFLPNWREEKWYDIKEHKINKNLIGKEIKISFSLFNRDLVRVEDKKKEILPDPEGEGCNPHRITGEVISQIDDIYIIDCDVRTSIPFNKGKNIHIGEYIQAFGRLDAYKIE
jgi:hypothetical protein